MPDSSLQIVFSKDVGSFDSIDQELRAEIVHLLIVDFPLPTSQMRFTHMIERWL